MYHVVQAHWGEQLQGTGVFAFAVYGVTAIVAGAVLHYLIERPFLRWRGRLPFTARKQVASPAAE